LWKVAKGTLENGFGLWYHDLMNIRPLKETDRERLREILIATRVFTQEEIAVAMELIDIVLGDRDQEDYTIHCLVDDRDHPLGYVCYGRAPMTQGTYDLYWIAVHPQWQKQGLGSRLLAFVEEQVRFLGGRMILVETSSIPSYLETQRFYELHGFKEVGRLPDYYSVGNDRITYCKRLR